MKIIPSLEIASILTDIGTNDGNDSIEEVSTDSWLFNSIALNKNGFIEKDLLLDDILSLDSDFKNYVENNELRDYEDDNMEVLPIIEYKDGSLNILDGYNRLHQRIINNEEKVKVYVSSNYMDVNNAELFKEHSDLTISKTMKELSKTKDIKHEL